MVVDRRTRRPLRRVDVRGEEFLELRAPDQLESRIRCRYRQCSAPNFHATSGKGGSRHLCRGLVVFGKTLLFSH